MPDRIVREELDLLARVTAVLNEPAASGPSEASLVEDLERLREMMQQGEKTEDQPALLQQYDRLAALLDQVRASKQAPRVNRSSPYFAHLRVRDQSGEQDILLGTATHLQRGVHIVDWRNAPISRIFYRYQQGDEYEETFAGRVRNGEVLARRTVTIREQQLRRIEAPEGIFATDPNAPDGWHHRATDVPRLAGGEGAALRAHTGEVGHRRLGTDPHGTNLRIDKHLPDIAGLIDPTQFELITKPSAGFVVIRGTAGSGKTTVALHRIAYLAYEDASVDSTDTMIVVFSPALRDYVGHVLPALGVQRVPVRTFHEWAAEQVRRLMPRLPRDVREDTPAVVQRLKLHPAMLVALERQVARVEGPAAAKQVIDDWSSVLCQTNLLQEIFAERDPSAFSLDALQRATDWNRLRFEELSAWLAGDTETHAELDDEDHALLLRAWQLRVGPLPSRNPQQPLRYRHIAVDEVQDFSPVEVRVLLDCLDEHRSITLAGDTQQHVVKDSGFTSWANFFTHLGLAGTEVSTLQVSYRCTQQIMAFAVNVLGDLREDDSPPLATRSGPPVELFRFTDHGACVAFLADALKELAKSERLASVAVLTPTREISTIYARGLTNSEVPRVRQVEHQDFTFAPGIEVTEIEQVKGLEFDYVIVVEVSTTNFPDAPAARRLLHVGATRAVHQLWLTSVGTPSILVRNGAGSAP